MELHAIEKPPLIKNETFSEHLFKWRNVFFLSLIIASFIFILSRLFLLQVVKGQYYKIVSDENRIRTQVLKAYRGVIKDRKGNILVQNSPAFNVKVNKEAIGFNSLIDKLSSFIDVSSLKDFEDFVIFENIDRDTAIKVETAFLRFSDVLVEVAPQREYLYPEEFAHILGYVSFISPEELEEKKELGYVNTDKTGVLGIEKVYDELLHGKHGNILSEYDSLGKVLREIARTNPINGEDLILSVDKDLQLLAYSALKKAIEETGAFGGALVAQEPKTGEVLALVSLPSFNPNLFSEGISENDYSIIANDPQTPLFNRVLMGNYPPGSVFKIVVASALLSENIVNADTKVSAPGAINIGNFFYRDWKVGGHGEVTVVRALAESADTFFYKVVGGYSDFNNNLGPEKLALWTDKFGMDSSPFKKDPWYIGDSYISAIGQGGVLATPMQVNQTTAVIANGGYLISPQMVFGDGLFASELIKSHELKPIIEKDVLEVVKKGLKEACALGGTGYYFFDFPTKHNGIEVACKTGTSEFGEKNAKGEYQTHAWFTIFAPLDDAQVVLTVFLEGGGGGADVAAPVARELLDWWFEKRNL
ncbi:MAG: penicillin-binding transpeptidase domain-containing protein [bacterium]